MMGLICLPARGSEKIEKHDKRSMQPQYLPDEIKIYMQDVDSSLALNDARGMSKPNSFLCPNP